MEKIERYIEQTVLSPTLKENDIERVASEALEYHFWGICVPPFWVKKAHLILEGKAKLVTVIGFPLGYQRTESKLRETELAIEDGADELDLVLNQGAFQANPNEWVKTEIARMAKLCHESHKILKVIIETAYLNRDEMSLACRICADAGVDFVKTSTGFAPKGADESDIRFMRALLPREVGIKASGGIRSYEDALKMIQAGADRLGTSSGVAIVQAKVGKETY